MFLTWTLINSSGMRMESQPALVQAQRTLQQCAPHVAELLHVVGLISLYLDASLLVSPRQAVETGSPRLLRRVLTRVIHDPNVDAVLRAHWLALAMESAIQKNDLCLVQLIHEAHPAPLALRSLQVALQYGSLALVEWMVENRQDRVCCPPGRENLCQACLRQMLRSLTRKNDQASEDVIEWLMERVVDMSYLHHFVRNEAALRWLDSAGRLEYLDLASLLNGMIQSERAPQVEAVRFLIERGTQLSEHSLIEALVRGASQPQLASVIDVVITSRLCDSFRDKFEWVAVRPGGAKVLQWDATFMREYQVYGSVQITHNAAFYAALSCHVDTLTWLWSERGIVPAHVPVRRPRAETDLLDLYQWMEASGVDGWCSADSSCGATYGYLAAIQWLVEHKPQYISSRTREEAARKGQLNVLQWLHDNWDPDRVADAPVIISPFDIPDSTQETTNDLMLTAAVGGHLDVLVWLHANYADTCITCVLAHLLIDNNSEGVGVDSVRWLETHKEVRGCMSEGRCRMEASRRLSVIREMQGGNVWNITSAVIESGDLPFGQYLLEHHRSHFAVELRDLVTEHAHLPMIQWLCEAAPDVVDWNEVLLLARATQSRDIIACVENALQLRPGQY